MKTEVDIGDELKDRNGHVNNARYLGLYARGLRDYFEMLGLGCFERDSETRLFIKRFKGRFREQIFPGEKADIHTAVQIEDGGFLFDQSIDIRGREAADFQSIGYLVERGEIVSIPEDVKVGIGLLNSEEDRNAFERIKPDPLLIPNDLGVVRGGLVIGEEELDRRGYLNGEGYLKLFELQRARYVEETLGILVANFRDRYKLKPFVANFEGVFEREVLRGDNVTFQTSLRAQRAILTFYQKMSVLTDGKEENAAIFTCKVCLVDDKPMIREIPPEILEPINTFNSKKP